MNSQDLRNLQEAYLDVYTELDEGRGDDLRKKHRLKPGEISRRLSHRADVRSFRYERDDPRRVALSKLSGNAAARSQGDTDLHGQEERVRRGGRITGTNIHTDADRDRGDKGERFADFVSGRRNSPNMSDVERRTVSYKKEETDLYDIILSHLLDEGYAKTSEAALAIMENMSEDWRESIVEKFSMAADSSKPQSPKRTKLPKSREVKIGPHNDWNDKPTEWGELSPAAKKLRSRAITVTGTQRRQDGETGVT